MQWIRTDGTAIVNEKGEKLLLRGFGFGGWLLPEGYMWQFPRWCDRPRRFEAFIEEHCGAEYAEHFWRSYRERFITEDDMALIARWGFNSVRLPFNTRTLFSLRGGELSFVPEVLTCLDRCIDWGKRHGLYVILDMHAAPGGQTGANIDDSEDDEPRLFLEDADLGAPGMDEPALEASGVEGPSASGMSGGAGAPDATAPPRPTAADLCVEMWRMIAARYADEPAVGAYDLLNEPLPKEWKHLNHRIMPLYRRIRQAIRSVDRRHMLMLEGANWATDWSIFDELEEAPLDDNYLLQFHKYWNDPSAASLTTYLDFREKLSVPLYMGEGGENNLWWYTGVFPLLEKLDISWNFWTYKKMECDNSPVSFPRPADWDQLGELAKPEAPTEPTGLTATETSEAPARPADGAAGSGAVDTSRSPDLASSPGTDARAIFDSFLQGLGPGFSARRSTKGVSLPGGSEVETAPSGGLPGKGTGPRINEPVFRALTRTLPLEIPAEHVDSFFPGREWEGGEWKEGSETGRGWKEAGREGCEAREGRTPSLRNHIPLTFCDRHQGEPDYQRLFGEPQPEDQYTCLHLAGGDLAEFTVRAGGDDSYRPSLVLAGWGVLELHLDGVSILNRQVDSPEFQEYGLGPVKFEEGTRRLGISVKEGELRLHLVRLALPE